MRLKRIINRTYAPCTSNYSHTPHEGTLTDLPVIIVNSKQAILQILSPNLAEIFGKKNLIGTRDPRVGYSYYIDYMGGRVRSLMGLSQGRSCAYSHFPPPIRGNDFHVHGVAVSIDR